MLISLKNIFNLINVTKTFIPDINKYTEVLSRAFKNEWLTNRGELVLELEAKLKEYLAVRNILIMNNGTIPIQIALKLLGENGEIITTPFSYVATTSSIIWENCSPVFVDIDEKYLTIDEKKIEAAITKKTKCILATHVFGNPCNIEAIEKIAEKYNIKVIYDAAHCFGVKYMGESIFNFGDISTCSFHSTKVFHTGEGGAIFCTDEDLFKRIYYSHNFGHNGPENYHGLGINAKQSELHSALGLSVLPHMSEIFQSRKKIVETYQRNLMGSEKIQTIKIRERTEWNYSYYPIIFDSEQKLKKVLLELNNQNIYPRRYFYPSLNLLPYVSKQSMPISENISRKILCLPLYHDLGLSDIQKITNTILKSIEK